MNWHLTSIKETYEVLGSNAEGLSERTANERLLHYGENKLAEKRKKSPWLMFLAQFRDFMILILILAALVSGFIGDLKDAFVIVIIVILNAVVGFVQEYRAEKAMEELKKMASAFAKVLRDNQIRHIPASQIVPGDLVLLESGDIVPADLRLTESHTLHVEEASLTGESYPIEKITGELTEENAPLGDRINMAFKGTVVNYGRGMGLAVETGMRTQIGKIAAMLQQPESQTPLQLRLADFGKKLSVVIILICAVIYGVGVLRGEDHVRMLLTAISVAVAGIPEALPAVITIALALGARKMVRKNALIRKLPAVETLGSVSYICTDKTGTLTLNQMTVREVWLDARNEKTEKTDTKELLSIAMLLNHDTHVTEKGEIIGDATEVALVQYARDKYPKAQEVEKEYERVHEVPFDSQRKLMTTVHRFNGEFLVVTKGALESLLPLCLNDNGAEILGQAAKMAGSGMRTLGYACKIVRQNPEKIPGPELENGLHFLGVAGMLDPPRPEAAAAVRECMDAGIIPVMITGDHPATAMVIAKEIGILHAGNDHQVIAGQEMAKLSAEELAARVERIRVYARVSPEQKLDIIKALQSRGHFVAMTGDGVNDAPSLKRANIGVAMGITGTDVTREAAHMILLDDNFATIVKAVREGRRIFDNIRKFIRYIMTGNAGEIWTIFLAPLVGLPIPLLPIHILWINLVTDGLPSLALAGERAERDIMKRPPRSSSESIFAHGVGIHILWVGFLIGALCLAIQAYSMQTGKYHWQTMVFCTLSFAQLAHVMAIRSESTYIYKHGLFGNVHLLVTVVVTGLLQIAIVYLPFFQQIFRTQALSAEELLICLGLAAVVFHAVEFEKWLRNIRKKKRHH